MRSSDDAFDELELGESAEITRELGRSGFGAGEPRLLRDVESEASGGGEAAAVAQGARLTALVLEVIATHLPGPGTRLIAHSLNFEGRVAMAEPVTARVTLREKTAQPRELILDCACLTQSQQRLAWGQARVIAPPHHAAFRRKRLNAENINDSGLERDSREKPASAFSHRALKSLSPAPGGTVHEEGARYRELIAAAKRLPPIRTAVVHPCDEASLIGALEAAKEALIVPILVGPELKIRAAAEAFGRSLDGVELVEAPHSHAAAARAAALTREGRVDAIMKGALHTDELMAAVLDPGTGLRTERRMSHVFAIDAPHYPKPLFITDAAINIYPDVETKRDIVQNAIDLARALMIDPPKVAILSAVETVTPKIPSTIDAAALCKMADRGQITGAILDGPLAFDNAVSREAARAKGIVSLVAGDADILVAPDLEAGNMLAKQLVYLGDAGIAGLVLGARVPIMLTSRADGVLSRLASAALAQIFAHWRKRGGWRKVETR